MFIKNYKQIKNEEGIVSIIVTIILMLVISLIVLSFAKVSRTEQRNAIDRHLSTQAFYAAETGINDAVTKLKSWPINDPRYQSDYMTDCNDFAAPAVGNLALPGLVGGPGSSGAATYTCLFVDPSPTTISYTVSDSQHIFPVESKDGSPLNAISIFWDDASGVGNFSACPAVNSNPVTWTFGTCNAPVLRVEIVDASTVQTAKEFVLYPAWIGAGGGSINYSATTGSVALAACSPPNNNKPNRCTVEIQGLNKSKYFVRTKSIYGAATVAATAKKSDGSPAELIGAQALVDATGKATDVVRRIQVRVQLSDLPDGAPLYGIEGTDKICKKFDIDGTTATDSGSCWGGATPN